MATGRITKEIFSVEKQVTFNSDGAAFFEKSQNVPICAEVTDYGTVGINYCLVQFFTYATGVNRQVYVKVKSWISEEKVPENTVMTIKMFFYHP